MSVGRAGTGDRLRCRFRTVWLVTFLVLVVLGTLWSVAQPPFSGADEAEHVVKAQAVLDGQWIPPFKSRPSQFMASKVTVHMPPTAEGQQCFIARAEVSAACPESPEPSAWPEREVLTYLGRHPVLPYVLNGAGVAISPDRSGLYWSRLLTTATGAAFLATAVAMAVSRRRPFLLFGILVATTPAVVAGLGVLSSSPLEIAAAALTWTMVALLADGEPPTLRVTVLTAVAASALALSRPISFLWVGLAGLALLVLLGIRSAVALVRNRGSRVCFGLLVLAVALSLGWFLLLRAGPDRDCIARCGGMWDALRAEQDSLQSLGSRLSALLRLVMGYWQQAMGAVGYNEYVSPWWVQLGWTTLIAGVVALAAVFGDRRRLVTLAGLAVILFALPLAIQTPYYPDTGSFWQGRYDLPLLAGIVVLSASALDRWRSRLPQLARLQVLGIPVCAALQMLAFFGSLRRFAVGVDGPLSPRAWASGWRPPIPVVPLLLLAAVGITLAYYWFGSLARRAGVLSEAEASSGDRPDSGLRAEP